MTRLVCSVWKYDRVTPLQRDQHWLRAEQQIVYRLAVMASLCQYGLAPMHLSFKLQRVIDVGSQWRLRSASTAALTVLIGRIIQH